MIDPIDSLAFSIEAKRGVYALLVGSGISFAADIPTGEQITTELIRRLAHQRNENCESDPHAWYRKSFGENPDYSVLIGQLAKTQSDRFNLLREFFEPSEEERQSGIKMPTRAHKAIAQLVSRGYIKAIITTNFDHLLERAIEDIGKSPTVISTREIAESAPPTSQTDCIIIKVNGDYLDPRIKNTYPELENYDEATDRRLDQIFDEYGLIVCGWSAEWDIALRRALERCKNHRYSTYWTDISEPKEKAKRLISQRCASFISISSADAFFYDLAERVIAIESYRRPHPISKQIAIARTKKYLVSDIHRIELYDLFRQETEKLFDGLSNAILQDKQIRNYPELEQRLHQYESLTEIVLSMIITGCYWGSETQKALWANSIERIANISVGKTQDSWLRQYPALLLFYGGGIASLANNRYDTFAELLMKPIIADGDKEHRPVCALIPEKVIPENEQKNIFQNYNFNKWATLSNYLYEFLKDPMKEFLHDDKRYQKCFDKFEYLVALQHAYLIKKSDQRVYGPIGRFGWKYRDLNYYNFVDNITIGGMRANKEWRIFSVGLFDGEFRNFIDIKKEFDKSVEKRTFGWIY